MKGGGMKHVGTEYEETEDETDDDDTIFLATDMTSTRGWTPR